jgi:hypothetical protein
LAVANPTFEGELARLLLASKDDPRTEPSWRTEFDRLLGECAKEVGALYARMMGAVADEGDAGHPDLTREEALDWARSALVGEIETKLREVAAERGEA